MNRHWLAFIIATILIVSVLPLVLGANVLNYTLIQEPHLPFGNLAVAIALVAFVSLGHVLHDTLYSSIQKTEQRLSRCSKALILIAALWLPIGYLLGGNFAGNFGSGDGFRGSALAGEIYWYYTAAIVILSIFLWLIATIVLLRSNNNELD